MAGDGQGAQDDRVDGRIDRRQEQPDQRKNVHGEGRITPAGDGLGSGLPGQRNGDQHQRAGADQAAHQHQEPVHPPQHDAGQEAPHCRGSRQDTGHFDAEGGRQMQHFAVESRQPAHDALLDQHVDERAGHEHQHHRHNGQFEHLREIFRQGFGRRGLHGRLIQPGGPEQQEGHTGNGGQQIIHPQPAGGFGIGIVHKSAEDEVAGEDADHEERLDEVHETGVLFRIVGHQPNGGVDRHFDQGETDAHHREQ